jgi:hypothetical protein
MLGCHRLIAQVHTHLESHFTVSLIEGASIVPAVVPGREQGRQMNIIHRYILPRFPSVVDRIGEDPKRRDFGFADFPTLIGLLVLTIVSKNGDRWAVIAHVQSITSYDQEHIQFMLDQYEGKHSRHHLWRLDNAGRYRLLI